MISPIERAYFTLQEYKHDHAKNIKIGHTLYHTYKVYYNDDLYFWLLVDNNGNVYTTDIYDTYAEDMNEYILYHDFNLLVYKVERE